MTNLRTLPLMVYKCKWFAFVDGSEYSRCTSMKHDFVALLKEKKLKVTPARIAILQAFSETCHPHNAESLAATLAGTSINLVTIYRALGSLAEVSIIKKIDLRKDSIYYELAEHHHHHIVCTECGAVEGFEVCQIEQLSKDVLKSSRMFTRVQQHSLELFGICNTCA